MPATWEASQRHLTELFMQAVTAYQGAIKIEPNFPRWEEQLDASTLTPRLYYYYLGNPEPQYMRFSKPLFDDCAHEHHTEDLAKAENIIRKRFDLFLENRHL